MLKGFVLSVIAGTIAGTAFPAIFLAFAIFGSSPNASDVRAGIGIAMATILIPLGLVAASAVLLGIPASLVLKKLGWENEASYMLVAAFLGFIVPGSLLAAAEQDATIFFRAFPAGILGAFSGAVTGRAWWRNYREAALDDPSK